MLDASWTRGVDRAEAAGVASETAGALFEFRCAAPPDVANARIARRRAAGTDASDATAEVARALRAEADPWPSATSIDTTGTESEARDRALEAIGT